MHRASFLACFLIANSAFAASSSFDGVWVLSGKWTGYMGLALKIDGSRYKYWFSSDMSVTSTVDIVGPDGRVERHTSKPPRYPLRGRLRVRGNVVELLGPGDYYDRKWYYMTHRGVPCLLADEHYREWKRTGKLADDRLLFRLSSFDEKRPTLNYGGLERPNGSVTATSPEPHK
ncbi:MAG: hypothetical protein QOG67_589 [Verrucomicrobiota bacterium]|jgi:hypothetical protein